MLLLTKVVMYEMIHDKYHDRLMFMANIMILYNLETTLMEVLVLSLPPLYLNSHSNYGKHKSYLKKMASMLIL